MRGTIRFFTHAKIKLSINLATSKLSKTDASFLSRGNIARLHLKVVRASPVSPAEEKEGEKE